MGASPAEVDRQGSSTRSAGVWDWLRLAVAGLTVAAVAATVAEVAGRTRINPFNIFGYFTIQSNLLLAALYILLGVLALTGRVRPTWAEPARAACVTYIVLVGIVYAVLLAPLGAEGGVPVEWANTVLHVVTPIYAVVDWVLAPGRRRLADRLVGAILIYPIVWLVVVLIRGATDGWVPYPFLDPEQGYGPIALTVLVISLGVGAFGWLVVRSTRFLPGRELRSATP